MRIGACQADASFLPLISCLITALRLFLVVNTPLPLKAEWRSARRHVVRLSRCHREAYAIARKQHRSALCQVLAVAERFDGVESSCPQDRSHPRLRKRPPILKRLGGNLEISGYGCRRLAVHDPRDNERAAARAGLSISVQFHDVGRLLESSLEVPTALGLHHDRLFEVRFGVISGRFGQAGRLPLSSRIRRLRADALMSCTETAFL